MPQARSAHGASEGTPPPSDQALAGNSVVPACGTASDPSGAMAAVLTRMQTVDLEDGQRPPQTLVASVPDVQTAVLLSVGGQLQAVTLPMTPEQCVAAGLTLANQPKESQGINQPLANTPTEPLSSSAAATTEDLFIYSKTFESYLHVTPQFLV